MKSCFGERSTRNAGWVNKKVKSVALDGQLLASLRCNALNTLASSGWPFCFSKAERWSVEGQWDKPRMHFFLKRNVSGKWPTMHVIKQRHYMHNGALWQNNKAEAFLDLEIDWAGNWIENQAGMFVSGQRYLLGDCLGLLDYVVERKVFFSFFWPFNEFCFLDFQKKYLCKSVISPFH